MFFFDNPTTGGGSRYLLDLLDISTPILGMPVLVTNRGGLTPTECRHIAGKVQHIEVFLFSRHFFLRASTGPGTPARWIARVLYIIAPLIFLLNVIRCLGLIRHLRPRYLISLNGGYPGAESSIAALFAARVLKVPSLCVILGTPQPRRIWALGYDVVLDKLGLHSANKILVNSKFQRDALVRLRAVNPLAVAVAYNGVPDFQSSGSRLRVTPTPKVIGVVGRVDRTKGLDDLLQALRPLIMGGEVRLKVVGDGPYMGTMQRIVRSWGLGAGVEFAGHLTGPELESAYADLDLFVFPSRAEGFPYVILEAMRAGLPIVTTNVGGVPEAVIHGECGYLVPPNSPSQILSAVRLLLDDPGGAAKLGSAAQKRFKQNFSSEVISRQMADEINEFWKSVCSHRKSCCYV
jgi:glycosyltransferase involved in cell wall biosynthesis